MNSQNKGNEQSGSRRDTTADKGNLDPSQKSPQSQQGGQQKGSQQGGQQKGSQQSGQPGGAQQQKQDRQQGAQIDQGRSDSQQQGQPGQRQSNDVAGGKSPGTRKLAADEDMDDDTGLSNRGNRQSADQIDEGSRQSRQSNVGRRDDGTPD
jgi:hypothetical protein